MSCAVKSFDICPEIHDAVHIEDDARTCISRCESLDYYVKSCHKNGNRDSRTTP